VAAGMSCERCSRAATYRFATPAGGPRARCLRHAVVYPAVFRRAIRIALVVGTLLFAINQLDVVLRGDLTPLVAAKIVLTFLVPFSVSTYSALQINRLARPPSAAASPQAIGDGGTSGAQPHAEQRQAGDSISG
jgi:hypothetical protein